MNLPEFPVYRPRRLRQSAALRQLVAETRLSAEQLVLPLFVRSGRRIRHPVAAMPGVFQLSPDEIVREAARAHTHGVPAILLFGIPDKKDAKASGLCSKSTDQRSEPLPRYWRILPPEGIRRDAEFNPRDAGATTYLLERLLLLDNARPSTAVIDIIASCRIFSPVRGNSFQSASGGRADRCRASRSGANPRRDFPVPRR